MSFFRKRQPSQTQAVAPPAQSAPQPVSQLAREIPGPSEVLKREQQQSQQALNYRTPDDRLSVLALQ
jgi:hypothetical protein